MYTLHSKKKFLGKLRNLINLPYQLKDFENSIKYFQNLQLLNQTKALQAASKNPLNHFGKKCFSQTDEDGITLEILRRMNSLSDGVYLELGVGDDYFGASLASFNTLFEKMNYKLVCCNSHTGSNAFFVDHSYEHLFDDIPVELNDLYVEPRYFLYDRHGHPPSVVTVQKIMAD